MMKIRKNSIHILKNKKSIAWVTFGLVNNVLEIYTIQVHERWRGYGFAKKILKELLSLYSELDETKACIIGGEDNKECINLFAGFGFIKMYKDDTLYMYMKM